MKHFTCSLVRKGHQYEEQIWSGPGSSKPEYLKVPQMFRFRVKAQGLSEWKSSSKQTRLPFEVSEETGWVKGTNTSLPICSFNCFY